MGRLAVEIEIVALGFDLSERFDTPVMLRVTTRTCHSMSPVELDPHARHEPVLRPGYERNFRKNVLLPANARVRHEAVEERLAQLEEFGNGERSINRIEWGDRTIGVVTSGIAYQYVREVLPEASVMVPLMRAAISALSAACTVPIISTCRTGALAFTVIVATSDVWSVSPSARSDEWSEEHPDQRSDEVMKKRRMKRLRAAIMAGSPIVRRGGG